MRRSKKVPQVLQESVGELAWEKLDVRDRRGYKHKAADHCRPIVHIAKDDLGINEGEIAYAEDYASDIRTSNENVKLDIGGRLEIS